MNCPICQSDLKLFANVNFARCPNDKLIVNLGFQQTSYEHDYFDKEYKTQYGKSYVADYQSILSRNLQRFDQLKDFINAKSHPYVLEVGSAAGYFLKIMQAEDFSVQGWEISKSMTKYANARGLKTVAQDFLKGARAHEKKKSQAYDLVAMFYVLEHLHEQHEVWQHASRMVRPGGFFALALPSASGPTFRFNRPKWYTTHPTDHAVDYSPRALRLVAEKFGFKLCHVSSEGIHPQRFPGGGLPVMKKLYERLLKRYALGDTIFAILERQ